jgi:hypothetical protein
VRYIRGVYVLRAGISRGKAMFPVSSDKIVRLRRSSFDGG